MPPTKSTKQYSLRQWIRDHEGLRTDGRTVFCDACDKPVTCTKKFLIDQHVGTAGHQKAVEKKASDNKKQQLITPMCTGNEFFEDLSEAWIAANIPWKKLSNPVLRTVLQKYTNRQLPDESTLRKNYLPVHYEKTIKKIQKDIGNSNIWASVDETTDSTGRFVANLIVGKLSAEEPGEAYLLCCKVLEKVNNKTMCQFFIDGLRTLWPASDNNDKVLVLTSDAAPYMMKAANDTLVNVFSNMIHCTCLAHGLHRVAEKIRDLNPEVNKLISSTKKVFLKAPSRIALYRSKHPELPLPPDPILTRWGTWINAASFYCENFQALKEIIDELDEDDAAAISVAKKCFSDDMIKQKLLFIKMNYAKLPEIITRLETRGMSLVESVKCVEDAKKEIFNAQGPTAELIKAKFQNVLNKNLGFKTLEKVKNVLCEEPVKNFDLELTNSQISALKFAPITSCEVERSFSSFKNVFSENRQSFTAENLEKLLVVFCNSKV